MKNVRNFNELEFKVIVGQAWEAEDTCFLVDYLTNSIYVGFNGSECIYRFEEPQIMIGAKMTLDGMEEYASEIRFVQLALHIQLYGKEVGVNKMLQILDVKKEDTVPITQTPYGIFVQ